MVRNQHESTLFTWRLATNTEQNSRNLRLLFLMARAFVHLLKYNMMDLL